MVPIYIINLHYCLIYLYSTGLRELEKGRGDQGALSESKGTQDWRLKNTFIISLYSSGFSDSTAPARPPPF
jgi:hypothetical protein